MSEKDWFLQANWNLLLGIATRSTILSVSTVRHCSCRSELMICRRSPSRLVRLVFFYSCIRHWYFSINLGFDVCLISLDVRCIDAFSAPPTSPICHTPPHADPSFSFRSFSNPCKVLTKLPPAAWFKTPTRLLPCPSKRPTNCARNVSSSGNLPNSSNSFSFITFPPSTRPATRFRVG